MGSGSNGPYGGSGSGSGSQPYAPTYHVVEEMLNQDKQDHDIYDSPKRLFYKSFRNSYSRRYKEWANSNGWT